MSGLRDIPVGQGTPSPLAGGGGSRDGAPRVTAIIVFLDAEEFIEEAIASVLAQTYTSWELILVDDGSTDGSTAIARGWVEREPGRIRYLDHPDHRNLGISAARNLGFANATGEYVGFLDADDLWLPEKLAEQVALLESHPDAAMVYGRTQYWHSWTRQPADAARDRLRPLGVHPNRLVEPPELLVRFLRQKALTPGTCSALMRRKAMMEVGGFEPAFRGMYEDQVFFTKLALHYPIYVAGAVWDRYRQRMNSCCNVALQDGEYDPKLPSPARERFLLWVYDYFAREGVVDRRIRGALNQALWPYRHPLLHSPVRLARRLASRARRLVTR
jgi:glycosyltransferase involved in cell wall biosynthesis